MLFQSGMKHELSKNYRFYKEIFTFKDIFFGLTFACLVVERSGSIFRDEYALQVKRSRKSELI
jgi:hypothetical protein